MRDCSGSDAAPCSDTAISPDDGSAHSAANALGFCESASGALDWVQSAEWQDTSFRPHGISDMHRASDRFGTYRPHAGRRLLILSTGIARGSLGVDASCVMHGQSSAFPPGFPMVSPACPDIESGPVIDSVALTLTLNVPSNAVGVRFASNFMTREYPQFLCSPFNDVYAVFMTDPRHGRASQHCLRPRGQPTHGEQRPAPHLRRRRPADLRPRLRAARRRSRFIVHARLRGLRRWWHRLRSNHCRSRPGSTITMSFMIWDSGDGVLDSVALIDAFEWVLAPFEQLAP